MTSVLENMQNTFKTLLLVMQFRENYVFQGFQTTSCLFRQQSLGNKSHLFPVWVIAAH